MVEEIVAFLTEKPSMANGGPGVIVPGQHRGRHEMFDQFRERQLTQNGDSR
jgi:hypothetical protein